MIWREPLDALRVVRRALRDGWDALFVVGALNLSWLALSLTVVLLPPATVALFESMDELASGRIPGIRDYFGIVRRRLVSAWAWALWGLVGMAVVIVNVVFWQDTRGPLAFLSAAFVVLGSLFAISVLYVWPFLFRQTEGGLGRAVRNSILAVLASPLYAISLAIVLVVLAVIGAVLILPLAVFLTALIGLVASHAVTDRLRTFGKLPPRPDVEDEAD